MQLGAALLVLVATWVVAKLFRRAIKRFLRSRHLAEADPGAVTRFKMIARLGSAAIYFVGLGIALYVVNVAAFQKVAVAMFASAGVLGIAIGFASQTTAANLVSGILIAFAQPLRLGDRVEVEQEQGSVEEIGLLYTTIRTWDNRHVMIPNQLLSSRVIRNYSVRDPRSPAVVTFGLSQDADLDWVRSMAIEEARAHADYPRRSRTVGGRGGGRQRGHDPAFGGLGDRQSPCGRSHRGPAGAGGATVDRSGRVDERPGPTPGCVPRPGAGPRASGHSSHTLAGC